MAQELPEQGRHQEKGRENRRDRRKNRKKNGKWGSGRRPKISVYPGMVSASEP